MVLSCIYLGSNITDVVKRENKQMKKKTTPKKKPTITEYQCARLSFPKTPWLHSLTEKGEEPNNLPTALPEPARQIICMASKTPRSKD